MTKIIITDIQTAFTLYMPYAMTTGALAVYVLCLIAGITSRRTSSVAFRQNWKAFLLIYILYIYCFNVVSITFLSREPGSRDGLNLRLFSTFSRHFSDNIFPVENVLLFIPLGILLPLLWNRFRNVFSCMAAGFLFSLAIEVSQLITGRGYFQTDDIMTNVLGTVVGYALLKGLGSLLKAISYITK